MSEQKIVECVPNFSEGRNPAVIERIRAALDSVDGATVLDVDPGAATHRTVITVVGEPEAVLKAAFQGIRCASEVIDMTKHQGEHPRQGATDVCPFIPVANMTMDECAELARRLGKQVGDELKIPVYLYEHAASSEARRNLAHVRQGEYEGLAKKLEDPDLQPDFGPREVNRRAGATAIGARKFLLAYNINLNTRAKALANEIAFEVREQGRIKRTPKGKFVRDENGVPVMRPGRLKHVKAVGWVIEEYDRSQVSCNLTDFDVSGLHDVFDACEEEAQKIGVRVTGSEAVGLVPLQAMLDSGLHYLRKMGRSTGIPEAQIIETAIQSLGLSEISPFHPKERIIEYRLNAPGELASKTLSAFVDETSSESPAPGGGSVAALCGALAAALCSMVGNLTVGKKKYKAQWADCDRAAAQAQELKAAFVRDIDADTAAFTKFMEAARMSSDTKEEKAAKDQAMIEATKLAIMIPYGVLERTPAVLALAEEMVEKGNPNASSDGATAAFCAHACAQGAFFNVVTNLRGFEGDQAWAKSIRDQAEERLSTVREHADQVAKAFLSQG